MSESISNVLKRVDIRIVVVLNVGRDGVFLPVKMFNNFEDGFVRG